MGRREQSGARTGALGVLDIGTSKICCLIAAPDETGALVAAGFGLQRSQGLKSGVIVEPEAAERSVRATIAQAERMAGLSLPNVTISVSCGRIRSSNFVARAAIEGKVVRRTDLDRLMSGAEAFLEREGRLPIQLTRSDWRMDGVTGVRDPLGMAGKALSVDLQAVTADESPVRNLLSVVERCHLPVEGLFAAPFASAIAVATEEERQAGVLVIDIGAGTTTMAGFSDGRMICVDAIPVGGNHVTFDISRALMTPIPEAERIKTLYGTLVRAASDESEPVSYPGAGDEEPMMQETSKARLREIIEPRIEVLLGLIEERLAGRQLGGLLQGRVVLTGGVSQLAGLEYAWLNRFGSHARVGRPRPIGRMPPGLCSPAFSTVVGLAYAEIARTSEEPSMRRRAATIGTGYLGRVQEWIRASF